MSKRFVSIWFPYLATDWFSLKEPSLKQTPFVLKASSHNRTIVAELNKTAEAKGIYKGMSISDAGICCPKLISYDDITGIKEKLLKKIAVWCIRFTPVAAVDFPDGIILDASGCTHLWGSDNAYCNAIYKRLAEKGFTASISMADTIGAAWALARFQIGITVIEPGNHPAALLELSAAYLRIDAEISHRLHKLGLDQIGRLLSIPTKTLRRRFGNELPKRLEQAIGKREEYINPIIAIELYQERLPCLEPVTHAAGIEIAIHKLLEALCIRLKKEGKGLRLANFICYRMDGKTISVSINTSAASSNPDHLFKLFQLKIPSIEPGLGIELFVLEGKGIENISNQQSAFWKSTGIKNNKEIAEFADRLTNKLGRQVISYFLPSAHYLPENSFKKTFSFSETADHEWRVPIPRPIILLSVPERIEVTAPVPDYPPMLFRYKNKLHKIIHADGPERIEHEWWNRNGPCRDYYMVEDEEGNRYWLFRSGHYDSSKPHRWFLHGFFG